jgi:SAM-dependent methyltransferase
MAETIEYQWVIANIPNTPCTILNVGSRADKTVESLSAGGYTVVGVDGLPDNRKIENYEFIHGDFLEMDFTDKFDCIYSISVVEHVGLDCYGQHVDADGDIKTIEKMVNLLKPGGTLLITVPYGRFTVSPADDWRVYDKKRLEKMIGDYDHSTYFFVAMTEIFIAGWKLFHGSLPPSELISYLDEEHQISFGIPQDSAEFVCSVACIKIQKVG